MTPWVKQYGVRCMPREFALLVIALITAVSIGYSTARASRPAQSDGSRSFVYAISNPNGPNVVLAYSRNMVTGELALIGSYPTGGTGTGRIVDSQSPLVANKQGTLLFAVNPGSHDISVMAIGNDGSLQTVGQPVTSRGVDPASLAIHENLLYIANKGDALNPPSYVGYFVEPSGELVRIKRRIELNLGANPSHILFNADGSQLIGTELGGRSIKSFRVKPTGRLRPLGELTNLAGPFGAAFNPLSPSQLVVSDARLPGASSFSLDDEGTLSATGSRSNAPERAACWIAIHPNGRSAWVANTGTHSLSLYTIQPGGQLTLEGHYRTVDFGRAPFEVVLDSSAEFLYELNTAQNAQSIHVMKVTGTTSDGGLVHAAVTPIAPGGSPIGLVIVDR